MTKTILQNRYTSKLILLFLLLFCSISFAQSQKNYSLLWKIEGKNMSSPSYLFGTMHVDDVRAFQFSDAVMPAIKSCDVFALEINPDSLFTALNKKVFTKTPKDMFKSVLSDEEYKKLVDRFIEINGFSFEDSEMKDPDIILIMLNHDVDKKDDKTTYVDMYLAGQAKTMRKKITGLEDIHTQISHYQNLNAKEQRTYILEHIEATIKERDSVQNKLTDIYFSGDIYEVERVINEDYGGTDDRMIERNKVMCASIDKIIKNKSLFSAVGVAHLPGKYGLINLLKKEGYTLSKVKAEFTGVSETYQIDESKMDWYAHTDSDLGYSVEVPGVPNREKVNDEFDILTYNSLLDGTTYIMFGMDLRHTPNDLPYRKLVDSYLENMLKTHGGEMVEKSETELDGIKYIKNTIVSPDSITLKSQMIIKGKMVYYLSAELGSIKSSLKSIDRYFNSIKFTTPKAIEIPNSNWQVHTYDKGAFSINVPGVPKDISRETPNPDNLTGDPYYLYMYNVTNHKTYDNYLFRYNDLPSGYHLENKEQAFNSMLTNFSAKGTVLSDPKPIYLNGYEGREYEMLLNHTYHSIARIYIRGNRCYLLLHQKINKTDKVDVNNPFFSDFKFIDYKPKKLKNYAVEGSEIEVKQFEKTLISIDTVDYDTSYLKNSHDYFTTNPNTGDVYQFGYGDLQDYFKTNDLNEFYDFNLDALQKWSDTLINKRNYKVNNIEFVEADIKDKNSDKQSHYKLWIDNKRFYLLSAFTTSDVHSKQVTDTIFNSVTYPSERKKFDIYTSKTAAILRDIKSKDTITRNRAIGAFSYYEFEAEDTSKLHNALSSDFGSVELNERIRLLILNDLSEISNEKTLKVLTKLYDEINSSDEIKSTILAMIPNLTNEEKTSTFLELLFQKPPQKIENNQWQIFSPFRDSIPLTIANYDNLAKLTEIEGFRNSILGISADILTENKDSTGIVKSNMDKLIKFSREDLANYIISAEDTTSYDYTYNGRIYNYLRLMETQNIDKVLVNDFTNKLINRKDNNWFKTNATVARIKNDLPIEKALFNSQIDSTTSRYRIMKAYHAVGKFDQIPSRYLSIESMSKLSLDNYLEDSDDYGYKIKLLDIIRIDGKDYNGASVSYEYETGEKESYFSLIGPIYVVDADKDFELYDIIMNWDELSEDWETQAQNLLKESKEED